MNLNSEYIYGFLRICSSSPTLCGVFQNANGVANIIISTNSLALFRLVNRFIQAAFYLTIKMPKNSLKPHTQMCVDTFSLSLSHKTHSHSHQQKLENEISRAFASISFNVHAIWSASSLKSFSYNDFVTCKKTLNQNHNGITSEGSAI